jgi:uncharacterized protein (DUF3084 family)
VSLMTKVFVVMTSILSIVVSCLFVAFAAQQHNWRELAQKYAEQRDAAQALAQNAVASSLASQSLKDDALAARTAELSDKQGQIQQFTTDLAKLQSELAQTKNERLQFQAGQTKLQEILDVTTGQLRTVEKQNESLLTGNLDLQSRNARLNSRVLELTANNTILADQARNLQEKLYAAETGGSRPAVRSAAATLDLPNVTVAKPAVAGPIRGSVTSIEGNYVSIDVGEASGVTAGMRFIVHRAANFLGEIVIDRVSPKEAGGRLEVLAASQSVARGDAVIFGLEN